MMPRFGPEQMQLYQHLLGASQPGALKGTEFLSRLAGGDPSQFEAMEKPAFRQYGQFLGQLGSRYAGQGMGGRLGSAFGLEATGAGASLAENLQAQRMGLQQQAIRDLLGMSRDLLSQSPYESFLSKPQEKRSWWQTALCGGLPIIGAGVGGYFGGPAGAALGGQLGSAAGRAFM
jgi:hypothetical protein